MAKIKTHQVLLQTPFNILKPDITAWTHSLTEPLKKRIPTGEEKLNKRTRLYALRYNYVLDIS